MTTHNVRYYKDAFPLDGAFIDTMFCQEPNRQFETGSFTNCTFVNCTFMGHLMDYKFTNCAFTGCDFSQVTWNVARWESCTWDDATRGIPTMAEERARLTAVVREIDAEPVLFDMSKWNTKTYCGMAHCIGGWLMHLFPHVPFTHSDDNNVFLFHNRSFSLAPNASAYFYESDAEALAWLSQFRNG